MAPRLLCQPPPSAGCAAPVVTAGLMARIPYKTSAIRSCPCRLVQNHPPQDGSWRGGLRSLGRLWFHSRMTCDPCLTLRSMHLAARRVHAFLCSHVHVLIARTLVPKKTLLLLRGSIRTAANYSLFSYVTHALRQMASAVLVRESTDHAFRFAMGPQRRLLGTKRP